MDSPHENGGLFQMPKGRSYGQSMYGVWKLQQQQQPLYFNSKEMDGSRTQGPDLKPGHKGAGRIDDSPYPGFLKQRLASMSSSSSICISNVIVAEVSNKSISLPISITTNGQKERIIETNALLDTGAGGVFIDQNFTRTQNLHLKELP